ncbi:class I fructose-bisphosphate aldolase [Candidatus Finniella inopinata]|uniref:fructose-bisphosphate aldolase n=1 Tax=Candidatus Finniella inopinata TaxID=1696036 RepID=A0A4Q7DPW7_9PROT|nr:class I fructose-bisphosphate aldolase [Candidatus Finniella inopinata]RZI47076.1 class I fructose-bisphosphate aldolase [Candidatus Finniella inopinata]
MLITPAVKKILGYYESDNPGVKTNLARLLMHGKLAGTGNLVILPVDQGFEHGPGRSYAANPSAYDPHYHFQMAVDGGLSAYAAPLGWLEAGADTFAGAVPTILKMNSSNSLLSKAVAPNQAVTASIDDALRLGCSAIGFTIYPGSDDSLSMFEDIRELAHEAKSCGLAVIIWSYARGSMTKEGETALDVIAYGAHMAALLGAHVIKVKLPTAHLEMPEAKHQYLTHHVKIDTLVDRVRHVKDCCFNGRRMVVFSGGETKDIQDVLADAKAIRAGGGNGSIIGRNCFQRPHAEAMNLLEELTKIYA